MSVKSPLTIILIHLARNIEMTLNRKSRCIIKRQPTVLNFGKILDFIALVLHKTVLDEQYACNKIPHFTNHWRIIFNYEPLPKSHFDPSCLLEITTKIPIWMVFYLSELWNLFESNFDFRAAYLYNLKDPLR